MLSSSITSTSLHTQSKFSRLTLLSSFINRNSVGIPALEKETTGTMHAHKKHTCHKCPLPPTFFFFFNEHLNGKFAFRRKSSIFMPRSMSSFHYSCWVENTDTIEVTQKSLQQKTRIFPSRHFLHYFLVVENINKLFNSHVNVSECLVFTWIPKTIIFFHTNLLKYLFLVLPGHAIITIPDNFIPNYYISCVDFKHLVTAFECILSEIELYTIFLFYLIIFRVF